MNFKRIRQALSVHADSHAQNLRAGPAGAEEGSGPTVARPETLTVAARSARKASEIEQHSFSFGENFALIL